ncbi:MAG: BrnT family toxin [Candidatus Margulisiibacteriota bacterium]|jgi:hypothetical protein
MHQLDFEWDQWNIQKNEIKHGISALEAETVFYDENIKIYEDLKHSLNEKRYILYGRSAYHKILMIAFTLRNNRVRIISARIASKKERSVYEE